MPQNISRFPVFKLPITIYEQIFSSLGPADLIDFSYCSKKCKNLIKSTRFPYSSLNVSCTNNERIFMNLESLVPGKQMTWTLVHSFAVRSEKRTICGVEMLVFKSGPNCMVGSASNALSIAVSAVCQFLCELFCVPIGRFIFHPAHIHNFRPIMELRNIQEMELNGDSLLYDDFQFLLENANVSGELTINMLPYSNIPFPNLTFNCDKLIIRYAYWTHKNTLLNSSCEHISMDQSNISSLECEEFIEKWINSNDTRLKSVQIRNRDSWIILENLVKYQLKHWDSAVRGRYYPTVKLSAGSSYSSRRVPAEKMVAIDCSTGLDITRSDGLIATVMYTNKQFSFVVWHDRFPNVDGLRQTNWIHN